MNTDFPEHFFQRPDESADENFYSQPRFVTHIDDATISCLTDFYREQVASGTRVLDLMSSWISHLPEDVDYAHVSGHGMNAAELAANPRLDDYCVQDLNRTPTLPFANNAFDAVLIAVSIQYLIKPIEVMTEISRCLAPVGSASLRCRTDFSPQRLFTLSKCYPLQTDARLLRPIWKKVG